MSLLACEAPQQRAIVQSALPTRITTESLTSSFRNPDDWHRLALTANWDFVDAAVWRAIIEQPNCDRATALAIFWTASPEYYVQFANRDDVPAVNRSDYDLITTIRERWLRGDYVRAELAFDPDIDVWPLDMQDLRRRYGARVEAVMPAAMRIRLEGRRLAAP
ncbi:MAG: DUF4274 domain-containing protein [Hyphomonadaceae bacterium]|nr:DUF4274 domain-containing protein [Hyphomonadaceae bacterium]